MWNRLVSNYENILYPLLDNLERLNIEDNRDNLVKIENRIKEANEQSRILSEITQKGYIDSALYISKETRLNIEIERLKQQKYIIILKAVKKSEELDFSIAYLIRLKKSLKIEL